MSFLDLPAEIRLYIYELSLIDLVEKTPCTCVKTPLHRFATFWSLSLTCREIYAEITSLFNKTYKDQVYLYFDDIVSLYDFYQYASVRSSLKDLHFCLRLAECDRCDDHGNFHGDHFCSTASYPNGGSSLSITKNHNEHFCWAQPGLLDEWHYYEEEVRLMFYTTKRLHLYIAKGYRFEESYSCLQFTDSGRAIACRTTYFPPTECGLHFSLHRGLFCIKELRARSSNLTFQDVDIDALKARIYHVRDSPWDTGRGWCCPRSPDLDAEERSEMDADSWGVPDRRSSEATEDNIEERWQLTFGGEAEVAEQGSGDELVELC